MSRPQGEPTRAGWGNGPRRGWLFSALALAGALAYLDDLLWAFAVVYAVLLALLLAAAWSWWCGRHLLLLRQAGPGERVVGELLVERFRLENQSGLPIRLVEVRDASRSGISRPLRALALSPRQAVSWEYPRRLISRGTFSLGPTELRFSDPLSIFPRRLQRPATESVVVHPTTVPVAARSLPGAARRGELLVLLDLAASAHRGEGSDSTLEYAVTVAASVLQAAAPERAVAVAASGREERRFPSGQGDLHLRNLLDYLACARADGALPFSQLVAEQMPAWRGRGGVVLITPDPTRQWVDAAAEASAPGARALAVLVDPALSPTAVRPRVDASWRLVLDIWVIRHGDDLARLDTRHGQAVV